MKSTLRLFKALPIKNPERVSQDYGLAHRTLPLGFIFSPVVVGNYTEQQLIDLIPVVEAEVGLSFDKANSSFHKSWAKVRDASIEQLILEQMVHYFTTYGFERLGIYSDHTVYIPEESVDVPEIKNMPIIVIRGFEKDELRTAILNLSGGIALKGDTVNDVVDIATYCGFTSKEIDRVRNKEVRVALYEYLDKVPTSAVEFLRYCIYRATGSTLLIKNKETFIALNEANNTLLLNLFKKYESANGLEPLAEIFYRFKPLFLAMRGSTVFNSKVNRIRKLAKHNHKPMPEDYLNTVTARIKNGTRVTKKKLREGLEGASIFRKIRLAYALNYRLQGVDSILYKVRNGKGYATEFHFENHKVAEGLLEVVKESIIKSLDVEGKKIHIPGSMKYALPASEKQFTGDLPSGTYIEVPGDIVVGVHWYNTDDHRVDLDLSILNEYGKYGWDAEYRSGGRDVLFSGDMTNAPKPNGASELFYIKNRSNNSYILNVNYYNYVDGVDVPMKIVVARESENNFHRGRMVDPNNYICTTKTTMSLRQKIVGFVESRNDGCRFYFSETNMALGRSARVGGASSHILTYYRNFFGNPIILNDILKQAGAEFVGKDSCDIDLSPEAVDRGTIISLLTNGE